MLSFSSSDLANTTEAFFTALRSFAGISGEDVVVFEAYSDGFDFNSGYLVILDQDETRYRAIMPHKWGNDMAYLAMNGYEGVFVRYDRNDKDERRTGLSDQLNATPFVRVDTLDAALNLANELSAEFIFDLSTNEKIPAALLELA